MRTGNSPRRSRWTLVAVAATTLAANLVTSSRTVSGGVPGPLAVQYSPQTFVFGSLLPGQTATGGVTVASATSRVNVTAAISNDTSGGRFRNIRVTTYDVERGPNGRPLDIVEAGHSDGVTPLVAEPGQ